MKIAEREEYGSLLTYQRINDKYHYRISEHYVLTDQWIIPEAIAWQRKLLVQGGQQPSCKSAGTTANLP